MKKFVGAIRKILAADLDLNYILILTGSKLESLVVTLRERIVQGSDNDGRILATRNSFPHPLRKNYSPSGS
jgi:hypothetical protein